MKTSEQDLYRRIKLLGEGSFGKAYLVECVVDKSLCVIKQVDLNQMKEEERRETIKEARILEALRHPNIVKFREVYKTKKGRLCIVMDYADGGDMSQKLKEAETSPISEQQILDWFTQLCLALKHVHDRKIIHRDLKTQNIFLTKEGIIKMGDFGIARVLNHTREKCKTMVGTPYYLSPEIIDSKDYSFKTDIWSLGVILYEMCALKPPFNAESLHGLALKIVRGQYPPIPERYSGDVKNLVKTLLNVDPVRRPTIHEVLKMPVIVNRIRSVLSESVRNLEFSHTILHKQNFVKNNLVVPYDEDLVRQKNQVHSQPIIKSQVNQPYSHLNNQPSQQISKPRLAANNQDYQQRQQPLYGVYPPSYLPQPQQQERYVPYQNRYGVMNKQNDVSPIRYGGQNIHEKYLEKDKSPIDRQVYLGRQALNNKKIDLPVIAPQDNYRYNLLSKDPYVQKSPLQRIQDAHVQLQKIPTKENLINQNEKQVPPSQPLSYQSPPYQPSTYQTPLSNHSHLNQLEKIAPPPYQTPYQQAFVSPKILTPTSQPQQDQIIQPIQNQQKKNRSQWQSEPVQDVVEESRMKESHLILKEIRQDKKQGLDDERRRMKMDIQSKRSSLKQVNKENEEMLSDWQSNVSNNQQDILPDSKEGDVQTSVKSTSSKYTSSKDSKNSKDSKEEIVNSDCEQKIIVQEYDALQILAELEDIMNIAEDVDISHVINVEDTKELLNSDVSDREDGQSSEDDNEDHILPKSQESQCELLRRILEEQLGYDELEQQLSLIREDRDRHIKCSLRDDNQWGALVLMLSAMESQFINNLNELEQVV